MNSLRPNVQLDDLRKTLSLVVLASIAEQVYALLSQGQSGFRHGRKTWRQYIAYNLRDLLGSRPVLSERQLAINALEKMLQCHYTRHTPTSLTSPATPANSWTRYNEVAPGCLSKWYFNINETNTVVYQHSQKKQPCWRGLAHDTQSRLSSSLDTQDVEQNCMSCQ